MKMAFNLTVSLCKHVFQMIVKSMVPPAGYVQGLGGADYSNSVTQQRAEQKTQFFKASVPTQAQNFVPAQSENPVGRDELVLRTPQELMTAPGQLVGRAPPSVSKRVITIPLEADSGLPIGTAWVYLYDTDESGTSINKARRVLKFSNRTLARIMCGPDESRYFFKDVEYIQEKGTADIVENFITEIKVLLDKKKAISKELTIRTQEAKEALLAKERAALLPQVDVAPPVAIDPLPVAQAAVAGPVSRTVQGQTFKGVVVSAGMTTKNGQNGSYKTFCLTLNDGTKEIPINGTEIQRQFKDMGLQIGERIQVVSMGKTAVNVAGQAASGYKNLFQVSRIGDFQ